MSNNRKNRALILAVALICAAIAGYYLYKSGGLPSLTGKPKHVWQKGMCYVSWTKDRYSTVESDASLSQVAKLGTEWVSIVTTWYQEKCYTTKIFPTQNTPTDESIIHAIQTAHSLGMKVMLKPHLDVMDTTGGSWRGEIACPKDPDWQEWFESYRDFILHYAKIAQANKVEMFCIGTELTSVSPIKEQMWKDIVIAPVRNAYKGPLTYAANWDGEYAHVKFWDALDYVGIDAYFPLSKEQVPTLEEIKEGWEPWVKEMEEFQKTVNKPIIFPEIGYCSADGTAITPWEELAGANINLELQANCYKAVLETFWPKEWFYGLYWWKWGTSTKFGGTNNRGYSPQNKPVLEAVSEWYHKPTPKRDFAAFSASNSTSKK